MKAETRLGWGKPADSYTKWMPLPSVAESDAQPDPDWNNRPAAQAVEDLLTALEVGVVISISYPKDNEGVIEYRRVS